MQALWGGQTWQDRAGPQEVTRMYGLEGARLSVCVSLVDLILFAA